MEAKSKKQDILGEWKVECVHKDAGMVELWRGLDRISMLASGDVFLDCGDTIVSGVVAVARELGTTPEYVECKRRMVCWKYLDKF